MRLFFKNIGLNTISHCIPIFKIVSQTINIPCIITITYFQSHDVQYRQLSSTHEQHTGILQLRREEPRNLNVLMVS